MKRSEAIQILLKRIEKVDGNCSAWNTDALEALSESFKTLHLLGYEWESEDEKK